MKVKRTGITDIFRRIWLFPVNEIKSSESFIEQPTQLIIEIISSLRHILNCLCYTNFFGFSWVNFETWQSLDIRYCKIRIFWDQITIFGQKSNQKQRPSKFGKRITSSPIAALLIKHNACIWITNKMHMLLCWKWISHSQIKTSKLF